jgi:hypothetical protein
MIFDHLVQSRIQLRCQIADSYQIIVDVVPTWNFPTGSMKSRLQQPYIFHTQTLLIILGSFIIVSASALIWLCVSGETFFSLSRPLPADVLIVEGWIGSEGVRAAADEFRRGGYKYVVATGGLTGYRVDNNRLTYAEMTREELVQSGVPESQIIVSSIGGIEHQRTFNSAAAALASTHFAGIRPAAINVFTLGPHARRSRLIYEKVYAPDVPVGVIAFVPSEYDTGPWWLSTRRTKCLLKEAVGYPFELLLNSGRASNSVALEHGSWGKIAF